MSAILTFILFFVYFSLRGRKTYLGARGDSGAGLRKIYYWNLFAPAPSTDIAKAKVMNDTCFEILPAVNCFPRRNFIGWEVYLSWNMWEFYVNGTFTMLRIKQFSYFSVILPSNKAERCIQENKSMRCDKLDEKSFVFRPSTPTYRSQREVVYQ